MGKGEDSIETSSSSFMVEMNQVAHILSMVNSDSLVLMDELGRSTSTIDGIAIAWSVCERLAYEVTCSTIMATHFGAQIASLSSRPPPLPPSPHQPSDNIQEAKEDHPNQQHGPERISRRRVQVLEMATQINNQGQAMGLEYQRKLVAVTSRSLKEQLQGRTMVSDLQDQEGGGGGWSGIRLGRAMGLPLTLIAQAIKVARIVEQGARVVPGPCSLEPPCNENVNATAADIV